MDPLPVWLSWEVLRLLRDMPTMACILAPMLERLFLSSVPTVPTAVSDWLPSVFSRLHMSPLMLVLLVMFTPPDEPICLFFILDAKSLSATTIDRGAGEDRKERTGQRREEARGEDVTGEMMEEETGGEDRRGKRSGQERDRKRESLGWKGEKDRVQAQDFMTYSMTQFRAYGGCTATVHVVKEKLSHTGFGSWNRCAQTEELLTCESYIIMH